MAWELAFRFLNAFEISTHTKQENKQKNTGKKPKERKWNKWEKASYSTFEIYWYPFQRSNPSSAWRAKKFSTAQSSAWKWGVRRTRCTRFVAANVSLRMLVTVCVWLCMWMRCVPFVSAICGGAKAALVALRSRKHRNSIHSTD